MIVAVEGISASGKTTWCRHHASQATVPEYAGPDPAGDPVYRAPFWAGVNEARWQHALELERATGAAFCDTDPIKLHYSWCLWQLGRSDDEDWKQALRPTRDAISRKGLGFADRILLLEPDDATISAQRAGDESRSRRNFELHLSLKPHLRRWYEAVDELCPGRVIFEAQALATGPDIPPTDDRYSLRLFDELIARLSSRP